MGCHFCGATIYEARHLRGQVQPSTGAVMLILCADVSACQMRKSARDFKNAPAIALVQNALTQQPTIIVRATR